MEKTVEIIEGKYGEGRCSTCKHISDDVDICVLRRCIHAIPQLKQAYEPNPEACRRAEGRPM